MGISKKQLVSAAGKLKNYTDTTLDGRLSKIGMNFTSEDGFGNLRWYNGHFQIFDTATESWVDTSVSPENVYVFNMLPQAMQNICCIYDSDIQRYKLKFKEPNDTVVDGQIICAVDKVIIRRKLNSAPENETDGELVAEIRRKNFGDYTNKWYIDDSLVPNLGDIYYYKAFPISTTGFANYSASNEVGPIVCKDYILYGLKIDQNESDPESMITYIEDNASFTKAGMDYTNDKFNYGDWESAWFIKNLKPCMLKYDGTVDYELDKNDYTKKADGTPSDISDTSYEGNVMVGIPTVWIKVEVDETGDIATFYISDKQLDDEYHAYAHTDANGNIMPYTYIAAYNSCLIDGKLRSLSNRSLNVGTNAKQEIDYAKANNLQDQNIWYTETFSELQLINILLLLIGKSTNGQAVFGTGVSSGSVASGVMNTKGLFWGSNNNTTGVKIFGIEHWWGNQCRRIAGWMYVNGVQKVKLTYGQHDGSTTDGYNISSDGYISLDDSAITGTDGTSGAYIKKMKFTKFGIIPVTGGASSSTYYCDGFFAEYGTTYAYVGGIYGAMNGIFVANLCLPWTDGGTHANASLSCKPLAS